MEEFNLVESVQGFPSENAPVEGFAQAESVEPSPELRGWEADWASKSHMLYPAIRAAAEVVPFSEFLFPSGRDEFARSSTAGKAVQLALDAVVFLPPGWIGKGLKAVSRLPVKLIGKGVERLPFVLKDVEEIGPDVLTGLMRKIDSFVYTTPEAGLARKYGLQAEEAEAVLKERPWIWAPTGRSGGFLPQTTAGLERVFTKKGTLKSSVKKDLARWNKPVEGQRLDFYKRQWKKFTARYLRETQYDSKKLFESQVRRLFGEEAASELTWEGIGEEAFKKVLYDSLLNEGKILRGLDISAKDYILPVRKVAGKWNKQYGLLDKLYYPMRDAFRNSRKKVFEDVTKFHSILVARGLGRFTKHGRFVENFSASEWREAGKLVRALDDAQSRGERTEMLQSILESGSTNAQRIVKSYQEFTDYLYNDYLQHLIHRAFFQAPLSQEGLASVQTLLHPKGGKINSLLTETLSAGNNLTYEKKLETIHKVLGELRQAVEDNPQWFEKMTAEDREILLSRLNWKGKENKLGVPLYLNNYGTRVYERGALDEAFVGKKGGLGREVLPSFVRERTLEEGTRATEDLGKMISVRVREQARDMMLNPYRKQWLDVMDELPQNLRKYFRHYLSRLLGQPSSADAKVAGVVNRIFGSSWDARRIRDLAYTINDLVYLGALGFKPFSAMRNYLQPFLLVPTDLGGIKDYLWLARGYRRAFRTDTQQYLKEIGALTEYSPDLLMAPQVSRFGKSLRLGSKELNVPSMQKTRDFALWMFKMSDRHNRYVTGGAALEKWEYYAGKYLSKGVEQFSKKINLASRDPWIVDTIQKLLRANTRTSVERAKKIWVLDVIGDTQFLYGLADSPLLLDAGGSVTRTAMVFQSWWMNYYSSLEKWLLRSGSVDQTTERLFSWMLSGAIAAYFIEGVWGKQTARRTVFTGPLPLSIDVPASWRPFRDALHTIVTAAEVGMGMSDLNAAKARAIATLKSSMIFVPGGFQAYSSVQGAKREGFKGFLKSLIKYRPAKKD